MQSFSATHLIVPFAPRTSHAMPCHAMSATKSCAVTFLCYNTPFPSCASLKNKKPAHLCHNHPTIHLSTRTPTATQGASAPRKLSRGDSGDLSYSAGLLCDGVEKRVLSFVVLPVSQERAAGVHVIWVTCMYSCAIHLVFAEVTCDGGKVWVRCQGKET